MKTFVGQTMFCCLVIGGFVPSLALTIRVPSDQTTIQGAINVSSSGDIIVVSPGIYFEHIDYQGKAIRIESADGPEKTIIDGSNTGTVVSFKTNEGMESVLNGFTIQHGNDSFGGGVTMFLSSPMITKNIFRENIGTFVAIGGNISSPVIEGNVFVQNSCDTQELPGVVGFTNHSSPLILNNVFFRNPCRAINMTLPIGNQPVIANNTIVGNRVGIRVFAGIPVATQLYANNILFANEVGFIIVGSASNAPTWMNNLVFGNGTDYSGIADQTGLNGNVSTDPSFLSIRSRDDFELGIDSPAIDAGTLSVPGLPLIDFLGKPRIVDGDGNGSALPDIGAYEFIPGSDNLERWLIPIAAQTK